MLWRLAIPVRKNVQLTETIWSFDADTLLQWPARTAIATGETRESVECAAAGIRAFKERGIRKFPRAA